MTLTPFQILAVSISIFSLLLALRMLYQLLFHFGIQNEEEEDESGYAVFTSIISSNNQPLNKKALQQLPRPQSHSENGFINETSIQMTTGVPGTIISANSQLAAAVDIGFEVWLKRLERGFKKICYPLIHFFRKYFAVFRWGKQKKLRVGSLAAFLFSHTSHLSDTMLRFLHTFNGDLSLDISTSLADRFLDLFYNGNVLG